MSTLSKVTRTMFEKTDNERDAGLTVPADIWRSGSIAYGSDPTSQSLEVYRPLDAEEKLPVIVSVHGGGWVYGDKERYSFYCMDLARRGFAVINFTYRLAPENKYPAPLEDTYHVFLWAKENAEYYKLDMDHLFAVGDSAGAHLLSLYCCLLTNERFASHYDFVKGDAPLPKAVGLNCGAYDFHDKPMLFTNGLIKDLMPGGGKPKEFMEITPLRHINAGFPPSYIMTAPKDFLKDDASILQKRLDSLGVRNEFHLYHNEGDTLAHVFHLNIRSEDAKRCNDNECAYFRQFI